MRFLWKEMGDVGMLPAKVAGVRGWEVPGGLQGWWHIPKPRLSLSPWDSRVLFPVAPACVNMGVVMGSPVPRVVGVTVDRVVSSSSSSAIVVGMLSRCTVL